MTRIAAAAGAGCSITPVLRGKKAYFEVLFLNKGKMTEVKYDRFSASKI